MEWIWCCTPGVVKVPRGEARACGMFWKDCDTLEFRSMAPFATSRRVDGRARAVDRRLFSMTPRIGPLTGRDDAARSREGI